MTRPRNPSAAAETEQPLTLYEDVETGDKFVLYATTEGLNLELRFEGEEPWATQKQMSDLLQITQPSIAKHIRNIFNDGELDEGSNIQKMNIAGSTKPVTIASHQDSLLLLIQRVPSSSASCGWSDMRNRLSAKIAAS